MYDFCYGTLSALIFIAVLFAANLIFPKDTTDDSVLFKVETNRIAQEIAAGNEININNYRTVAGVYEDESGSDASYVESKRRAAADNINVKAGEIERYVNVLIDKINSGFMEFKVESKEVYLSDILKRIKKYYYEKLKLLGTDFIIADYADCLLVCDPDRMEEVLQNIMKNAIKYGD